MVNAKYTALIQKTHADKGKVWHSQHSSSINASQSSLLPTLAFVDRTLQHSNTNKEQILSEIRSGENYKSHLEKSTTRASLWNNMTPVIIDHSSSSLKKVSEGSLQTPSNSKLLRTDKLGSTIRQNDSNEQDQSRSVLNLLATPLCLQEDQTATSIEPFSVQTSDLQQ